MWRRGPLSHRRPGRAGGPVAGRAVGEVRAGVHILTNAAIEASRAHNPFAETNLLIARLDHLACSEDLQAQLSGTDWDLIVGTRPPPRRPLVRRRRHRRQALPARQGPLGDSPPSPVDDRPPPMQAGRKTSSRGWPCSTPTASRASTAPARHPCRLPISCDAWSRSSWSPSTAGPCSLSASPPPWASRQKRSTRRMNADSRVLDYPALVGLGCVGWNPGE